MSRLEEIKERLLNIGGKPWKASNYSSDYYYQGYAVQSWNGADVARCIEETGEVDFIVNAPSDIEYLLNEVERLSKTLRKISTPMPGSRDNELVKYYERIAKEALDK